MYQKYSNRFPANGADRRAAPRIDVRFPVTIRGADAAGVAFEALTASDDISTSGVRVATSPIVTLGMAVTVVVHFCQSGTRIEESDGVMAQGEVVRAERRPGGRYHAAIRFWSYFNLDPD